MRRDAARDTELVYSPTAMLDQFTPFWPGSFWMAIVQRSQRVMGGCGMKRGSGTRQTDAQLEPQNIGAITALGTCGQTPIAWRLCLRRRRKPSLRRLFAFEPRSDIDFVLVVAGFDLCVVSPLLHHKFMFSKRPLLIYVTCLGVAHPATHSHFVSPHTTLSRAARKRLHHKNTIDDLK